jgi:hypothetical protein
MASIVRIIALLVSTLACLLAQTATSSLSGTISDPSGALVPGVETTIVNLATGASLQQLTTPNGLFAFPSIPAGAYSLSAAKPSFKTLAIDSITLQVASPLHLDLTLALGDSSETISVSASTEILQTSNASLGNVIEQKAIADLPLNGRNPLTLLVLEPGVSMRSGNAITVNGARSASNNVTIDGIDANESSNPSAVNNVFRLSPDAVQEFKVTTSNPTPEEGRNSGASISIATRSGTNSLHGRAFHFFRNTALNANEFFANAQANQKPDIKLNQYGFELGGPIRRNRTFFFGSYQGQRINYAQSVDSVFGQSVDLYTASARSGIFRYFVADPVNPLVLDGQRITQNSPLLVNPSTGALKPGVSTCSSTGQTNCVASYNIFAADPAGIGADPAAFSVLNSYPLPNSYAAGDGLNTGVYVWNPPIRVRGPQLMARIDHIVNPSNSVFARFLHGDNQSLNGDPLNGRPQVLPGFPPRGEVFRPAHNAALSWRRVVSPRIVNEFTAGYARFKFLFTRGEANPGFPDMPAFVFNNSDVDYTNVPRTGRTINTYQLIDNLSIVSGSHLFRFGVNIRFYQHNDIRGDLGGGGVTPFISLSRTIRPPSGFITPPLASATSAGISSVDSGRLLNSINDLIGIPARIQQLFLGDLQNDTFLPYRSGENAVSLWVQGQRLKQYNFYAQDEFKLARNLTLNYGLRWEINPAPTEAAGRVWVPDRMIDGSQGTVSFVKAKSWFQNNNLGAFAPRLSLAWSPGRSGRTVIRSGYGIAFDTLSSFQVTAVAIRVPGQQYTCSSTLGGTTTPGCTPAPDLRLGAGFPSEMAAPALRPSTFLTPPLQTLGNAPAVTVFDQGLKVPTVHQWNLTLQRDLHRGLVVQAGYVGRRATRLYRSYNSNQIDAAPILPSFLAMRSNVANGCAPSGSNCPSGASSTSVPIVNSGIVNAAFVNSTTTRTELAQNAAGSLVTRIEQTTLAGRYRPNQQFGAIVYIDNGGDSNYHSLQLSARKRFDSGLLFDLAYTFGKSIDNQSLDPIGSSTSGALTTTGDRTPADARNSSNERGRSDFDRRHILNLTGVYELPFGRRKRFGAEWGPVLNAIAGGWSLNGFATSMSGEPFSVRSGVLTANSASQSRAAIVGPMPEAKLQSLPGVVGPSMFSSTAGFAIPAPGSLGAGRNIFTGPSFKSMDLGLAKSFRTTERTRLIFRAEAFNAFNHPNFESPRSASSGNPSILSPLFGQTCCVTMSTASSSNVLPQGESWRVIQLALKLEF